MALITVLLFMFFIQGGSPNQKQITTDEFVSPLPHRFSHPGKVINVEASVVRHSYYTPEVVAAVRSNLKLVRSNRNHTSVTGSFYEGLVHVRDSRKRIDEIASLLRTQLKIQNPSTTQESRENQETGQRLSKEELERNYSVQQLVIPAECSRNKTAPWRRKDNSYTILFSLKELPGDAQIINAAMRIHFKGCKEEPTREGRVITLIGQNIRAAGQRKVQMFYHQRLNSSQSFNLTIDVVNYFQRWLRSPLRNKGLSLVVQSLYGLPLKPTDCFSAAVCRELTTDRVRSRTPLPSFEDCQTITSPKIWEQDQAIINEHRCLSSSAIYARVTIAVPRVRVHRDSASSGDHAL